MTIIQEIERVITKLPKKKALVLRYWLNEFKAARRYKQLKAYAMTEKAFADFEQSNSNASWN